MFTVILQKFVIFLVYQFFVEGRDILNLYRPKPDLPQELNDFLKDVQQHKRDFAFIRTLAKHRRKYEKSLAENHNLFAEDLDNQLTLAPYYNKRHNYFENQNSQIEDDVPNMYDQVVRSPAYNRENSFRSFYPSERYSKFIHSPIRLKRKLATNYLDSRIRVNPNGIYGDIKRPGPKYALNRFENDENKYHTGYVVGIEGAEYDDYPELRPSDKKKREVEISIKSDGKLIKRIEEDENGPKSIILNIKANPNEKSQLLSNSASQTANPNNAVSPVSNEQTPINKILENDSGNSKTIPSLSNSNDNQNGVPNKNIGVPINSIPASSSALSNTKNKPSSFTQRDDSNSQLNSKNDKESVNQDKSLSMQQYNARQESKMSDSADAREKVINGYNRQPQENFQNSKWIGESNQMAKSIDIAQNNVNGISNIKDKANVGADLEEPKKESEFEKVQGLIVDRTPIDENNMQGNKVKYTNKRQLNKEKRWNEIQKEMDSNSIPLDVQEILSREGNRPFDYAQPLDQEAIDLSNLDSGQQNHENMRVKMGDHEINLNPIEKFEIIEQSTKKILIIPIIETTTDAQETSNDGEEEVEAKIIGDAVADEIKQEEEPKTRKNEETTKCPPGKRPREHQQQVEITRHEKDEECNHGWGKNCNEKIAEIDIVRSDPEQAHYQKQDQHKIRESKRQVVKKKKKTKYIIKNGIYDKPQYSLEHNEKVPNKFQPAEEKQDQLKDDALRDKKHMPPVAKHKRKRLHPHHKKRVDRINDPSLVDYYHFNEIYGPPDDTFDFIPAFYKRQLKSVNYEFDPNLIQDVGNHEAEEIKKFNRVREEKEKTKQKLKAKDKEEKEFQNSPGHRKKFKSEGEYSDEEESFTVKSVLKKVPLKKSKNQFAPVGEVTTEDNDDDYNYEDISDMDDEEEDVAYEEEKIDDLDVDEPVGSNNISDLDNDRLNINRFKAAQLVVLPIFPDSTTNKYVEESVAIEIFSTFQPKGKELEREEENEDGIKQVKGEHAHVAHGHGTASKKYKKKKAKKPKRNDENDRIVKAENKNFAEDVSKFHGRGNNGFKIVKHKKIKPKRQDIEPTRRSRDGLVNEKVAEQFEIKPLSDQEKQDIFLRYNPDFQRWPRFVQSDNTYRQLMKRKSLENQKRYFQNGHNMNRFPISNGYFLDPKRPEFAKREEPSTESTTTAASSETSEAASSAVSEETTASTAAEQTTQSSATEESFAEPQGAAGAASSVVHAEENINSATLPQAAKNILQTANSDIFENTTVPGLQGAENENISGAPNGGHSAGGEATQFQFTTNADDLTENTQCGTPKDIITVCPDENAGHMPGTITSVLPIVQESATMLKTNMSQSQYLDLNDIVGGHLPRQIVSQSLSGAKGHVRQGLNKGKFNMNLKLSSYNSRGETKMILKEMTNLMLKLKYHSTCQILPANLETYVKIITKNEMDGGPMAKIKEMDEIDFDEHQSGFVFHAGTGGNDTVQNKAGALKELLNKYNHLPDECKERAEPVKEYIESHLAMIDNMSGKENTRQTAGATLAHPLAVHNATVHPKAKKEISLSNSNNGQEKDLNGQLMEEGLNNQNPDANEAIEDNDKKSKRAAAGLRTTTSPQYGKLAEAVRNIRRRRERAKRISEIYGRAKRGGVNKDDTEEQSKRNDKGFESPLVINF